MIVDSDEWDHEFLFYALKYHRNEFIHLASGASQRNLNGKVIKEFKIAFPPLPIQRKIADILSAYDDLIENNTRRIQILEEMAHTIYREWFVNFRFPGHENVEMVESELGMIPEGWETRSVFDLADVTYGYPFSAKQFSDNGNGMPVIRIRDIRNNLTRTFTSEEAPGKYVVEDGDILVGMDGDFHMGRWAGGQAYLNQRVARIRPKATISPYFLFWALKKPI